MNSPRAGRAASVSSAGTNVSTSLSFLPRYTPRPEPAYISAAAACDHVTHLRDQDQFDPRSPATSPTNDGALFSEQALSLLNTFLDALLYNFLAKGHGTSLSQLRPAITEVLKPKLARDALASADEELRGLIGEADADIGTEEELTASQFGGRQGWQQDWHLEMAFKRMRLRVMVFIRLGDFDDEDEDRFLEEDDFTFNGLPQSSQDMDFLASPAAVYIASVLEHVAEQALSISGDAAYARSRRPVHRHKISEDRELEQQSDKNDIVMVEERDIEKIALNSTLGRLWRTWRKNYRTMHGTLILGSPSPPGSPHGYRGRLGSLNEIAGPSIRHGDDERDHKLDRQLTPDEVPEGDVSEHDIAANIPLPMSDNDIDEIEIMGVAIPLPMSENDVDEIEIMGVAIPLPMGDNDINEIEVPGLAKDFSDEEDGVAGESMPPVPQRPLSATFSRAVDDEEVQPVRPPMTRLRSNSAPTRSRFPFNFWFLSPAKPSTVDEDIGEPTKAVAADEIPVESSEPTLVDESKTVDPTRASTYYDAMDRQSSSTPHTDHPETILNTKSENWDAKDDPMEESKEEPKEESDKEDDKVHSGVVVGALTGAAVLVGSAIATVAGYGHSKDTSKEETDSGMPEVVPKSAETQAPRGPDMRQIIEEELQSEKRPAVQTEGALKDVVVPSKPSEEGKAEITGQRSAELVKAVAEESATNPELEQAERPTSQLQAPLEDADLKSPLSATAMESEKEVVPVKDEPVHTPQKLSDPETFRSANMSEKELVPAPLQLSGHDHTDNGEMNGDHDMEAIGVARTSNVPIHSHSPSPPPERSFYQPTSNKGAFQGRNDGLPLRTSSRDRSLVGADDVIAREPSGLHRNNTGPSPLREVTKQEKAILENEDSVDVGDTPHAVPFYHRPVDAALKQQALNRASKEKDTAPAVPPKDIPPLQTNFMDGANGAARPQSSRSTSSTTPTGHSAKGSGSSGVMPRNLDKRPSDESKRRDFDSLLKNEETVKYTLTPEDLRESDARPASSHTRNSALSGGERSPRIVTSTSPTTAKRSPPRELTIVSNVTQSPKQTGSPRLSSLTKKTASPKSATFQKRPSSPRKVVPRVSEIRKSAPAKPLTTRPDPMNTNSRKSGFLPREPRVLTDDTRDFADFVRSTRPTAEAPLVPLVGSPPASDKPTNGSDLALSSRPSSVPTRSASRSNMVPREPDVKGGGSTDLIDFIRQGPPGAHINGHRIPRTVAPFRSTMDSDDLSNLGSFSNLNTTASPHTSVNSSSRQSTAPTVNSNSGLLASQNGTSAQRNAQSSLSAPQGAPQIVRKTRRVKDPYAIDSDDEDDLLTALPNGRSSTMRTKGGDESLEEFLRNTEPPKANGPAPVKTSLSNGHSSAMSTNGTHVTGARPRSRSNSQLSTSAAPPVRAPGSSMTPSTPRPPMAKKKFEARAAGATRNGFGGNGFHYSMNDMADFLRSSGPPDSGAPSPQVPLSKKPSKRGKKFWQRAN